MIFYIKVEVDEYKQRYHPTVIIEDAVQGTMDALTKLYVNASVEVSPDMVKSGLSS